MYTCRVLKSAAVEHTVYIWSNIIERNKNILMKTSTKLFTWSSENSFSYECYSDGVTDLTGSMFKTSETSCYDCSLITKSNKIS